MKDIFTIVPNPRYTVSLKVGVIDTLNNKVVFRPNEIVKLDLYGRLVTKSFHWFYLLAKYQVSLPSMFTGFIGTVEISEFDSCFNLMDKVLIRTSNPVLYKKKYGLILNPRFSNGAKLAVSENGTVIDIDTDIVVKESGYFKDCSNNYEEYILPNSPAIRIAAHRLIAAVWCSNDDPANKWMVNHIDGCKANNHASNLEWVTPKGNSQHAVRTGLAVDNIRVVIKKPGVAAVIKFPSITTLGGFLKTSLAKRALLEAPLGRLWCGYEVRTEDDPRPWYYVNKTTVTKPVRYTHEYNIYNGNKKLIKTFFCYKDVNRFFKFYVRTSIPDILKKLTSTEYTLEVINAYQVNKSYEAMNINTGERIVASSICKLAVLTTTLKANIALLIKHGYVYRPFREWVFRVTSTDAWDINKVDRNVHKVAPKKVIISDVLTNETSRYDSISEASRKTGISKKTLKAKLDKNIVYKNSLFKTVC